MLDRNFILPLKMHLRISNTYTFSILTLLVSSIASQTVTSTLGENKDIGKQIFNLLNTYRQQKGLAVLSWNDDAYAAAAKQSAYQVAQGQISHDNFSTRAACWQSSNENVAMTYGGVDSTIAAVFMGMWKNSAGHNANMLSSTVDQSGISVVNVGNGIYYATMFNVKGKNSCPATVVSNTTTSSANKTNTPVVTPVLNVPNENKDAGQKVFAAQNDYRVSLGLKPLVWNEKAYSLALAQSTYMAAKATVSMTGSADRAKQFIYAVENEGMCMCESDASSVNTFMSVWKGSDYHKLHMTDPKVTEGAVSVFYVVATKTHYVTLLNVMPKVK